MRVSGWMAVIAVLAGIGLTVVALLWSGPGRPIIGLAGAALFLVAIACGLVYVVREGGGIRASWERLGHLWRAYATALAAAILVAAIVAVLVNTEVLPPGFLWVLVVVWLGAPLGSGVTAAVERRRRIDAIIRQDLVEQEREAE